MVEMTGIIERNNVTISGEGDRTLLFAHGFGCDQSMWRHITPKFVPDHRVITYDLTGAGSSDLSAYDFERYSDLEGHADDILQICEVLDLEDVVLIGHSVSASSAVIAANRAPDRFDRLVLVSPSPSFANDPDGGYIGGFSHDDLQGVIDFMEDNYLGWSEMMAPRIAGQAAGEPAAADLTQSFCRTDPDIAKHFGRVTFFSDRRDDMKRTARPSLVLHCSQDALVPMGVADWMRDNIPNSTIEVLPVTGHCPHMTAPELTASEIRAYLTRG